MPWTMVGFIVGGLVSMGMPGLSGFIAEIPIYMGVWQVAPIVAIISVISIVVTAAYILLVVRKVFFGDLPKEFEGNLKDITVKDKIVIGLLSLFMIAIGLVPSLMVPLIETGVNHILAILGGA
jgi:NADH-quinone oxidoreductase subunit M